MPYPNDNKLNIVISQTSASADSTGKFPFVETLISGSNLFLLTDSSGFLSASTSIPNANFTRLTSSNLLVTDNTTLGDSTTDLIKITGSLGLSGSFSTISASFSDLAANRIVYTDGNKILSTDADLTFDGTTLTATTISNTSLTSTNITSSNISASGFISASSIRVENSIIDGGSLTVLGNSLFGDNLSDTSKFTGSVSITGSLSVDGRIYGTVDTASTVIVSNIESSVYRYSLTFVSGTNSAQSIYTDTSSLSWYPATNKLQLGTSGEIQVGSGNALVSILTDPSVATVSIGTLGTGSLTVGGNTTFKVNAFAHTLETDATSSFTNQLQSTSWTNGALTVAGGVGIGKNLYVSGSTFLYGDLTIFGSSSVVNISSSTVVIGDNRILLNAGSPIIRYAGIDVYDSGSGGIQTNVTSSMLWDSLTDSWILFSANKPGSNPLTASSAILIGGPTSSFGSEATLTTNYLPKAQSSGKNLTNSLLFDDGETLGFTGTRISASQVTASNAMLLNVYSTNISSSTISASNATITNVYNTYISSSIISGSNLRIQLTGSITYATGVLVTYITGSFNTLTLSTGSYPGNAPGLVPNAPTSSGMPGQINVDNNFIYVYTNNIWKRVPLSQWSN